MFKQLAAALALTLASGAGMAQAAPADIYASIYADRTTPYLEPANGAAHAFLCLSAAPTVGPQDTCFGFFSRPEGLTSITFADSRQLTRAGAEWIERPAGFHFVRQPGPADRMVLFDANRKIAWVLSQPRGPSILKKDAAKQMGGQVVGITFDPGASAFIGGNARAGAFQESVLLPIRTSQVFQKKINPDQGVAIEAAIARWNAANHHLGDADYIDAIGDVAQSMGAKLPVPAARRSPVEYVAALARANP